MKAVRFTPACVSDPSSRASSNGVQGCTDTGACMAKHLRKNSQLPVAHAWSERGFVGNRRVGLGCTCAMAHAPWSLISLYPRSSSASASLVCSRSARASCAAPAQHAHATVNHDDPVAGLDQLPAGDSSLCLAFSGCRRLNARQRLAPTCDMNYVSDGSKPSPPMGACTAQAV